MSKTIYKVWIHVEKINEDKDVYQDVDLPLCAGTFKSSKSALKHADSLAATAEDMDGQ
jgi:hypothetical protein